MLLEWHVACGFLVESAGFLKFGYLVFNLGAANG